MKKYILVVLASLQIVYLSAQTAGELSVQVTTTTYGGTYATKHVVAIWVQNKTGVYIKTLLAYAATRKAYLSAWGTATSSTYNTIDAITGATQSVHGTLNCTWNGSNLTGTVLGDDTYNVVMEMTEGGNNKLYIIPIKKGLTQQIVTPANVSGFSNITVKWIPASTAINSVVLDNSYKLYPNPAKTMVYVSGSDIKDIQLYTLSGKYLFSTTQLQIDICNLKKGVYLVQFVLRNGNLAKRIIKN
jgi:Predicted periplasmic protein